MVAEAAKYAPWLAQAAFDALPTRERFVLCAAFHCDRLKIREDKPYRNRSEVLDRWARLLGYPLGSAWCGIFVTMMLRLIGYAFPLPPSPGSTHSWVDWARSSGRLVKTPRRGDVWVQLYTGSTGHMGVCLGDPDGDGLWDTIEGNTNDEGSREGYEVARRERAAGAKTYFIRLF